MADVNFKPAPMSSLRPDAGASDAGGGEPPAPPYDLIELLFFAYRDFTSDPDTVLSEYGFGRAHHRVLHFVNRNPGMRVTDLLAILKITKQSLGRVLKQLVDEGFVMQEPGPVDRRERLLFATPKGMELARRLTDLQSRRIARALAALPEESAAVARQFLYEMIDVDQRKDVLRLIAGERR
ncbi:MarR family transcriptional regulator [Stappia sp. F7233]|uniref:MarR family transcriptional regulator n=1 Tax=Stappia albiluteola TaxID=2758565 RepID=A0A839A8V5_9HYPH|nr:MarR family transcriptional regulator [Stappia albiluteola]MBA5775771.1 MarR family transcriptional regulator [Stappia albiluteola]